MSERVLPASHPVIQRALAAGRLPLPPISATEVAGLSDRIDSLALAVADLPNQPMTPSQKDRLRIVARELTRRAGA